MDASARAGALDCQEALCILAAMNSGAHRCLGYGSFLEYLGRAYGDRPADAVKPELIPQVIHSEVLPETMALWREALARVRKDAGESISEDEAIRAIARIVLEGPTDAGRAGIE